MPALVPLCVHEATSRHAQYHLRRFPPAVWWGSLVEELHLRGPAIGQGRRVSWILGYATTLVDPGISWHHFPRNLKLTAVSAQRYDRDIQIWLRTQTCSSVRGQTMIKVSGTVDSVLKRKGSEVWAVTPDHTVYEAIERMADKAVGALLVVAESKLVGVISERDYARKVILKGRSSKTTLVKEIMTSPVIFVTSDRTVDECMDIMTRNRIRHLPIMQNEKIIGVVSIGDLVKWVVSEQEETIEQLHNYISSRYPS
jgi:CBS domain-containing protein